MPLNPAIKKINEEFGDLLFTMVNLSRFIEVDPEVSLKKATEKFMNRFRAVESLIKKGILRSTICLWMNLMNSGMK